MGTSETRAGYIQSPTREEHEKTTLVPEGGAEFNIPGNLVSLHHFPRSRLWVFLGNVPETHIPDLNSIQFYFLLICLFIVVMYLATPS